MAIKPGGDDCAIVGCYPDGNRVKVAFHKVWKGGRGRRNDLKLGETVMPYLIQQAHDYNLVACYFDPSQAIKLADDLQAAGIRMVEVKQSHSFRGPLDTSLFEMVANRALVLYDHPDLKTAAAGANVKEIGGGLLFIQKAGRAKIDLLIALSHCAHYAHQATRHQGANIAIVGWDHQAGRYANLSSPGPCQQTTGLYVTYTGPVAQILEGQLWQPGWAGYLQPAMARKLQHSRPNQFVLTEATT